jgi:hypothetical protein
MNIGQQPSLLKQSPLESIRPQISFTLPRPSFIAQEQEEESPAEPVDSPSLELITCVPFPLCSVNLITCSSNSGKTHFLDQIVRHRHRFFESPDSIQRIVFVNGNQRDFSVLHPWTIDSDSDSNQVSIDLEVVSLSLDEFTDIASILQPRDLLILDDILKVNDDISFVLKFGAHHYSLSSVFVITQSCLSSPLYSLLSSVHSVILLFGNSITTRLAHHLVNYFFFCPDTKKYLKSIFALAEKKHDIVILKLNTIASHRFHSKVLAFTGVQGLFVKSPQIPYAFMYPELSHLESLVTSMPDSIVADLPLEEEHLNETFVLVPMSRVRKLQQSDNQNEGKNKICGSAKEEHWNEFNQYLSTEIKSTFPYKRWNPAFNLSREILRCTDFCISSDFRTISTKQKPNQVYSIIDFLNACTRKASPGETRDKVQHYKPLVQVLLKNNIPQTFIINKLLLPDVLESRHTKRQGKQRRSYYDDMY